MDANIAFYQKPNKRKEKWHSIILFLLVAFITLITIGELRLQGIGVFGQHELNSKFIFHCFRLASRPLTNNVLIFPLYCRSRFVGLVPQISGECKSSGWENSAIITHSIMVFGWKVWVCYGSDEFITSWLESMKLFCFYGGKFLLLSKFSLILYFMINIWWMEVIMLYLIHKIYTENRMKNFLITARIFDYNYLLAFS